MKVLNQLLRTGRRAREIGLSRLHGGAACGTCGFAGLPLTRNVLWPELIRTWELTPEWTRWMDQREGSRCAWCGSSLRSGQLAAAIVSAVNERVGSRAATLSALFRDPRACGLAIAEINSAGNLHRYLKHCPGLCYSEFGSQSPIVSHEDLTKLSYADARFDLVVTSDTLEHVPDIDTALHEVRRVLKPGGSHVFSTPVVWDRPTRQRAVFRDGALVHLLEPSYHGPPVTGQTDFLVFYEFGADFVDRCAAAGFETTVVKDAHNPALTTFIAKRPA